MFRIQAPPADLQHIVRFFWTVRAPAGTVPVERVIPDGCCELVWHLADPFRRRDGVSPDDSQPEAFLFGQLESAIRLEPLGEVDVLGVRFAPAGVAALWGIDMSSLGSREFALDELFPARRRPSIDRLRDTLVFAERCGLVADYLRSWLRRTVRVQASRAMAALSLMETPDADLKDIAREIGCSRRRIERAFRSAVGLSPAAYLRLQRINRCIQQLRTGAMELSAIAADAGFADQSHFCREFRKITGLPPSAYRSELGQSVSLVP